MMYDLIIIGAGPAGMAASIYASRYKLKHLVIGREIGGTALKAFKVENYPGFESIAGFELMQKFQKQVRTLGAEIKMEEVKSVEARPPEEGGEKTFTVTAADGEKYSSRALILAMGAERKKLNIPGEEKLMGQGVSYCATCDAALFKNKTVAVIGGSNAAATSAILLAEYAKKVYLIFRKDKMTTDPAWTSKVESSPKIEKISRANVLEIRGENKVEAAILDNEYLGEKELKLDGVFIAIGSVPSVHLAENLGVETDGDGYLKINPDGSTSAAGVFAAGDITAGSNKWKQIITAAAEGAVASHGAYDYLQKSRHT